MVIHSQERSIVPNVSAIIILPTLVPMQTATGSVACHVAAIASESELINFFSLCIASTNLLLSGKLVVALIVCLSTLLPKL